jgi:hypothetical protein
MRLEPQSQGYLWGFMCRDPDAFATRLGSAARPELNGWYFHHNPVEYFDPYEILPNQYFDPAMSKAFHFAYQREYRFLWTPFHVQQTNGFKTLHLGPLTDIASFYS